MTIDAGIKKRFLIRIVDDDVGVRAGLTFLLKCLGWSSVDYLSAEEFLEKDNMLIPGCILLDIRMPGMSGLALQQKLFSDGVQLPVVIITGYADVETAVRTLKRGAFDFLEKPIEAEKLDAVLENCWNRWNVKNSGQSPQKIAAIFHEMSGREKGIVRLLVQELTSKQIGDRLGLSERTVQGHRLNLYKKFGVHTRDELLSCLKVMEELSD